MSSFHENAIFWVETGKIHPNPYQPRKEFHPGKLQDLADSIRQYGVLQPLVVTRREEYRDDGSMSTLYELIAGERRLRAAKLAGVLQVPVLIRSGEDTDNIKLELAIIENLQREDLNPVDRARAFAQLAEKFGYKHGEIGKKIGRSREYVSNSIRLLALPEEMLGALSEGKMREGHTRPLLMLSDKPDEQRVLFQEIVLKNMTVRDAEQVSRRIAHERARTFDAGMRPDIREFEERIGETLGTRVHVQKGQHGGKVVINFSTEEDLQNIMRELRERIHEDEDAGDMITAGEETTVTNTQDREGEDDIYSINNFSI